MGASLGGPRLPSQQTQGKQGSGSQDMKAQQEIEAGRPKHPSWVGHPQYLSARGAQHPETKSSLKLGLREQRPQTARGQSACPVPYLGPAAKAGPPSQNIPQLKDSHM